MEIERPTDQGQIKHVASAVLLLLLAVIANQYRINGVADYFTLARYWSAFSLMPALVLGLNYYPLKQLIEKKDAKWPDTYDEAKPLLRMRFRAYVAFFGWLAVMGSLFYWQAGRQGFIPTKNVVAGIMFIIMYGVMMVAFVGSSNAEIKLVYFLKNPKQFTAEEP